jgi:hypothetical protein
MQNVDDRDEVATQSNPYAEDDAQLAARAQFFHDSVAQWLSRTDVTIACGRWEDGAISEFMPNGQAHLLPGTYDGCFAGVRELRLKGQPHHLHIDFGRVHKLAYVVSPSVCFDFNPSFELRLLMVGSGGAPTDRSVVSFMLESPYVKGQLDTQAVSRFFGQASADAARHPDFVELTIDEKVRSGQVANDMRAAMASVVGLDASEPWDRLIDALVPAVRPQVTQNESPFEPLLRDALELKDAALVFFRDRMLVEFQTEKLKGMQRYEEAGHVSWQLGDQRDHHCHVSLDSVAGVLFSAEPVSCQGGGLNYTVWFLTGDSCGNPYRRNGYFSITLNRPYTGSEPRLEVIEPIFRLYERYKHLPVVQADETFLQAARQGPPARHEAVGA